MLLAQSARPAVLSALAAALLIVNARRPHAWGRYVWRSRWLLLTAWGVVAYGTPGDAWRGLDWAPSEEGLFDATWHGARLILMLGCLAALFVHHGRHAVLSGLCLMLVPAERWSPASRRLLVRLALVLESLEQPLERGAWRRMLCEANWTPPAGSVLSLNSGQWRLRDTLVLGLSVVFLIGIGCL